MEIVLIHFYLKHLKLYCLFLGNAYKARWPKPIYMPVAYTVFDSRFERFNGFL